MSALTHLQISVLQSIAQTTSYSFTKVRDVWESNDHSFDKTINELTSGKCSPNTKKLFTTDKLYLN